MICLPLIVEIVIIYSFFVLGAVFDQKVGNFQDKIPIAGSDDPKIQLYQAGRMGTCFIIMGLTLIKWGTDFMIPPTTQMGFSYQEEMQKYKEIEQLQRRQGLVVGSISFVCFIGMFLVCFADSPIFEDYYYVILPLLKFFEYLLSLVFLKGFRDQLYIMPIRFGLKMSILIMILSFEKLHKMIAGYVILFIMRIFEESLYVRFHQTFVLSYFSKTFEKTEGLRQKDSKLRRKYINSLSELGDKSTSVLITWMYPVVVAFVYLFYDFTAYSILQIHFLYYLIFLIFFIAFEPLVQILINYLRILSDRSYFCPAIHEHSSLNFKQRQTSWSLSYLKIHDESLDLSGQVKTLFCTGFSAQLYLLLSTLGFGMIIFMIGVKLLSYNSYSPFLDYWLFLFGLFTYVTCLILKILTIRIGKKIGWKISSLNNLYQIDARGEIIRSREDYIQDRFVRAAMNNASKQDNTVDMMISETSDDVIQLIKNQENRALLSFRIGEMLNKFEIISKLDKDKIFKDIQRKADVFSAEQLREKIQAASDPIYKINLIATQRIKECRSHPKFPVELLYKWR